MRGECATAPEEAGEGGGRRKEAGGRRRRQEEEEEGGYSKINRTSHRVLRKKHNKVKSETKKHVCFQ